VAFSPPGHCDPRRSRVQRICAASSPAGPYISLSLSTPILFFFQLFASGLEAEVDVSGDLLSKKVGRSSFYNFILVVGQKEMDTNTVNVRSIYVKQSFI
jgi:threonyl-tRNA synthetase